MPRPSLPPDRDSDALVRVVLTGAESTGKTTLAARLAAHYATAWVPEYVRGFVERKGAAPEASDVEAIARGVLEAEAAARDAAGEVLFLDTDLLSTALYADHFYGAAPPWIEAALAARPADLYLLLADDIPWQPDPGQRDSPAVRTSVQRRIEAELHRRALPFARIEGTRDARFRAAVRAVDRLLGRGAG